MLPQPCLLFQPQPGHFIASGHVCRQAAQGPSSPLSGGEGRASALGFHGKDTQTTPNEKKTESQEAQAPLPAGEGLLGDLGQGKFLL